MPYNKEHTPLTGQTVSHSIKTCQLPNGRLFWDTSTTLNDPRQVNIGFSDGMGCYNYAQRMTKSFMRWHAVLLLQDSRWRCWPADLLARHSRSIWKMTREVKATVNKPKGRDAVCSGTHLPLIVHLDAPLRADSGQRTQASQGHRMKPKFQYLLSILL